MRLDNLYKKAMDLEFLSLEEGLVLHDEAPLPDLQHIAHEIRKKIIPGKKVGWMIDRNVNITNVCISGCKFCNFHRKIHQEGTYVTSLEEYRLKIKELFQAGGNQLLLQGGMHPKLGVDFYTRLFGDLKKEFPSLRLHALGPPEIAYLAKKEKISYRQVLETLVASGLDSLPGGGAEILHDRVRKAISPGKCGTKAWLDVMREAHKMDLTTSATMMFGHVETIPERLEHLIRVREVQAEKPAGSKGFVAFIPWPFQDAGTRLRQEENIVNQVTAGDYIRTIAISRILLPNINNIQASWLTVGTPTAQLCLHAGANDLGSIMIEENVVSAAGAVYKMDAKGIQQAITEAGFVPYQRDQEYREV